jgi:hypothetical protein
MITKEMTISEIARLYPQTVAVFNKFGLDWLNAGCGF